MKGTVTALNATPEGEQIASVETDYGVIVGVWEGQTPSLYSTVFVEIEFEPEPDPVAGGQSNFTATSPARKGVLLTGIAETWHDGVLDLRIGPSLVQVELSSAPPIGHWLTVKGDHLRIFDSNL